MNHIQDITSPKSHFILVGWCRHRDSSVLSELQAIAIRNKADFVVRDFDRGGTAFLINTHPDMARTDDVVLVNIGLARDDEMHTLRAKDLLAQDLVTPDAVRIEQLHGSPLTVCVNVTKPDFSIFQSVTSTSQMHYWKSADILICCDALDQLIRLVRTQSAVEANTDAVVQHLMFRNVVAEMTHFKHVYKMLGGQLGLFRSNEWKLSLVQRFDDLVQGPQVDTVNDELVAGLDQRMERIVGSYLAVATDPCDVAVLLSGGVDSSLITRWAKANTGTSCRLRSLSYVMRVSSFQAEMDSAQEAVALLDTEHAFYEVSPIDYLDLLRDYTLIVAQPADNEQDPCFLTLARANTTRGPHLYLSGSAANSLLGAESSKRLIQAERVRGIPAARTLARIAGTSLSFVMPNKAFGARELSEFLKDIGDQTSPYHVLNALDMWTNLDVVMECFGEDEIRRALACRLHVSAAHSNAKTLLERHHINAMMLDVHDEENAIAQVFNRHGLTIACPFIDTDFIGAILALNPAIRYYFGGRVKWLTAYLADKHHLRTVSNKPKLSGGFRNELFEWMKSGPLVDAIAAMQRPAFMSQMRFDQLRRQPDWLTWNLLSLDIFQKAWFESNPVTQGLTGHERPRQYEDVHAR